MRSTDWIGLLAAYYGKKLTAQESELWWNELTASIDGLSEELLSTVIRDRSFDKRDKFTGKPDLSRLRMWIFMHNKDRQKADGSGVDYDDCAMCYHGWVTAWPNEPETITAIPKHAYPVMQTPCRCPAGEHVLRTAYKDTYGPRMESLNAQSQRAIRQRQAITEAAK